LVQHTNQHQESEEKMENAMKRILPLVIALTLVSLSCKNDEVIVQTHQYNNRSSGDFSLGPVHAIVVENQLGPVIIDGNSRNTTVGWFQDRWVTAESQTSADQVFSQMLVNMQTSNDTAYITVLMPTRSTSCTSSLSLTVPYPTSCILRKVGGACNVSYLQSSFIGENVATTTIQGHQGNCVLSGSNGDASVEISLPDSGLCRVMLATGNIRVRIPATTSSMLEAHTGNGTIVHTGLAIGESVQTVHSFTGKLGTGRANIQLTTGTGNITVTGF
jgi:hypothetical protein